MRIILSLFSMLSVAVATSCFAAPETDESKAIKAAEKAFSSTKARTPLHESSKRFPDGSIGVTSFQYPPNQPVMGYKEFATGDEERLHNMLCATAGIVRARASDAKVTLTDDKTQLLTRTKFNITDVIKGDAKLDGNAPIFVTQPGGELEVNGARLRHEFIGGSNYVRDTEYVLVLNRSAEHRANDYFSPRQYVSLRNNTVNVNGGIWYTIRSGGEYEDFKAEINRITKLRSCK